MPGMMRENSNQPWWAPGRPLIVSDPNKLTYFAQANAVRAGVQSMPGALQGVDVGGSEWAQYPSGVDMTDGPDAEKFWAPELAAGNRIMPTSGSGPNSIDASGVGTPSGGGTLDAFFTSINNFLRSPTPNPYGPQPSVAPSPWPWVIGAGAVGIGLLWLSKRRRS